MYARNGTERAGTPRPTLLDVAHPTTDGLYANHTNVGVQTTATTGKAPAYARRNELLRPYERACRCAVKDVRYSYAVPAAHLYPGTPTTVKHLLVPAIVAMYRQQHDVA